MPGGGATRPDRAGVAGAGAVVAALLLAGGCAAPPDTVVPAPPRAAPATESPTTAPAAPGPSAAPDPAPSDGQDLGGPVTDDDLLALGEEMTSALADGDVDRWESLLDVGPEALEQQRAWFSGVQSVPMSVREMHPVDVLEESPLDGAGQVVEFAFRHQVDGADPVPSVQYYELTVGRSAEDGGLRVLGVDGDAADPTSGYPQLWDLAELTVLETEHVVLLAESGRAEDASAVVEDLEEAAAQVFADFPVGDGDPVVDRMVVSAVDEDLVATLFGDSVVGDYAGFAAPLTGSPVVDRSGGLAEVDGDGSEVTARLVVDLDYTLDEQAYFDRPQGGSPLLRHEGLHLVMMLDHPLGFAPPWASEGLAGWYEASGDPAVREDLLDYYGWVLDDLGPPEGLPPDDHRDFFSEDPDLVDRHYVESAVLFHWLEQEHGTGATREFGRALHALGLGDLDDGADAAAREHLGVGLDDLGADFVGWVAQEYPGR